MSKTCLMVIDVQQALVDEGPDEVAPFLNRLESLLAAARGAGIPVIHVQHNESAGEELEPETPGWELHASVRPREDEPVFGKHFNSAFKETGLEDWLRTREIGTLVVCGMQTEHCIDASIKSAFERGFRVIVPEGAHTTCANGGLSASQLRDFYQNRIWKGRYADVKPVQAVLEAFQPH